MHVLNWWWFFVRFQYQDPDFKGGKGYQKKPLNPTTWSKSKKKNKVISIECMVKPIK